MRSRLQPEDCIDCPQHSDTKHKHGQQSVEDCVCLKSYSRPIINSNGNGKPSCTVCPSGKYKAAQGELNDKCTTCEENSGTVKEILGSCNAVGCTVDGMDPKDCQQACL